MIIRAVFICFNHIYGRGLALLIRVNLSPGEWNSRATCFSQGETLREQVGRAAQRSGLATQAFVRLRGLGKN
ncbi:MAG: hypothetical protein RMY29_000865 [Nostoc sp. CreGUA01]